MNQILDRIEEDYIKAIKSQDQGCVSVLRMLKSALVNAKISQGEELDDNDIIGVIRKEIKTRHESIVYLEKAGKINDITNENSSIEQLKQYLPPELSEEEIESRVDNAINQVGSKSVSDFGKIMGVVMQDLKGKADASKVSFIIKGKLV